ncbi:E3 ubiquitin/ISG15 ligase TRIM25-like [Hyperolius riggenbachi]|uniref:E3 ubiquitin/ISG15 ligase TRIM25-like n=1 Tax=Hyperolius riggenbachi TaxID=752182 RepID=UPI0035A3BAD8
MAFTGLRDSLNCSVCLNVFSNPVTLKCGHNFCRVCIARVLQTQEGLGVYSCPECREEFLECPGLQVNTNIQNIVEMFHSTNPETEDFLISCTYCMDSPVPAVKTCLHCEISLCEDHLRVHPNSAEHVLIGPVGSLSDRKCPLHKKTLAFYCYNDSSCICDSCCLAEHIKHEVKSVECAFEKKKDKLKNDLQKLTSKTEEVDQQVRNLQLSIRETEEKGLQLAEKVTDLFRNFRRWMEVEEKKALSQIFREQEQLLQPLSQQIQLLEMKKEELAAKLRHIEELSNTTDPLMVLQDQKSDRADVAEERDKEYLCGHNSGEHLDEGLIFMNIHSRVNMIMSNVSRIGVSEASDILLDVDTAANNISVSQDLKSAFLSTNHQNYPQSSKRFEDGQILSFRNFSSGQHYWEVETSEMGDWMIGLAYTSMDRSGDRSWFGENDKSWCLARYKNNYSVIHNGVENSLSNQCLSHRFWVYLDYEAGRLSFYELVEPVRHLHTFSTTFTEPLHAAFGIVENEDHCWLRIRS